MCFFLFYFIYFFLTLWLYSPIQALAASMKLSLSLQLLDLRQSVGRFGRVIYLVAHRKTHTQHKH
jgi:hypothetical protein